MELGEIGNFPGEWECIYKRSKFCDGFCACGERREETTKERFQEGIEHVKAKFPNTLKLLEEDGE